MRRVRLIHFVRKVGLHETARPVVKPVTMRRQAYSSSMGSNRKYLTEPYVSLREATFSKMSNSQAMRTTKTSPFDDVPATS